jgi:FlaA1/EpsC-like NDP-sugar epimerase
MTSSEILQIIGRNTELFDSDVLNSELHLAKTIRISKFLVLGGAGSIGQAVTKEIFSRNPAKLHVVDISENNLVELVRDLRSSIGYIDGDFKTFALDIGSLEYDAMIKADGDFDYVLNLSALKHVRSEEDAYTLMRMIDVNITNTVKTIRQSIENGAKKYFCVSTDKAANPVNMMGASKRIMELFLWKLSSEIDISTARFANVAFSDGSLLHGFNNRIDKKQPIVAPSDVTRFFVTPKESGQLCLMSCLLGEKGDTFFPQESDDFKLLPLDIVAKRYLALKGLTPKVCETENEARDYFQNNSTTDVWPCYFPTSDTTGEKEYEEFYTDDEILDLKRFNSLGIIKNECIFDEQKLKRFEIEIKQMREKGIWTKEEIVQLFQNTLPTFDYHDKGKYLDSKM